MTNLVNPQVAQKEPPLVSQNKGETAVVNCFAAEKISLPSFSGEMYCRTENERVSICMGVCKWGGCENRNF